MARKFWGLLLIIAAFAAVSFSSSPTGASTPNSLAAAPTTKIATSAPASPLASVPLAPVADQVINDDLIVSFSGCFGNDCVNGESFGFDTLRLKENNLRIKFQDTSNSASFPTNDWTIVANDSSNGGNNYLAFEDTTAGTKPFLVEAGAGNNALYVDSTGQVGFGTNTPVVELHTKDGDTPTLRLEQDGSNGWPTQTWDVAGNETNFFIRDVSNGSKLPFKILPGNDHNVLVLNNNRVGVNTNEPTVALDVNGSSIRLNREVGGNTVTLRLEQESSSGYTPQIWDVGGNATTFFIADASNGINYPFKIFPENNDNVLTLKNNRVGINTSEPTEALTVNGAIHASGGLTRSSDRNLKENIEAVDNEAILNQILETPVYYWNYTADAADTTHLGPMAQDFNAASDLGSDTTIDTLDVTGALIASVQALNAELEIKNAQIDELEAENADLEARLAALEAAVAQILATQTESKAGE